MQLPDRRLHNKEQPPPMPLPAHRPEEISLLSSLRSPRAWNCLLRQSWLCLSSTWVSSCCYISSAKWRVLVVTQEGKILEDTKLHWWWFPQQLLDVHCRQQCNGSQVQRRSTSHRIVRWHKWSFRRDGTYHRRSNFLWATKLIASLLREVMPADTWVGKWKGKFVSAKRGAYLL